MGCDGISIVKSIVRCLHVCHDEHMTQNQNHSPGTASQAVLNEIASWTEEELDARIAAAFAKPVEEKR